MWWLPTLLFHTLSVHHLLVFLHECVVFQLGQFQSLVQVLYHALLSSHLIITFRLLDHKPSLKVENERGKNKKKIT